MDSAERFTAFHARPFSLLQHRHAGLGTTLCAAGDDPRLGICQVRRVGPFHLSPAVGAGPDGREGTPPRHGGGDQRGSVGAGACLAVPPHDGGGATRGHVS